MRRFHFVFILFLPLLLFLILKGGSFFFNTSAYAQDDGSCRMGGAYSDNLSFSLVDKNIRIANGSTVCQFIHDVFGIGGSSFYFFDLNTGGDSLRGSLDFMSAPGSADDLQRKTYFECQNGVWKKKQTTSYCQNREGDKLINKIYTYSVGPMDSPLLLNVTETTLATPTPTSILSLPANAICLIRHNNLQMPLSFYKEMCLDNVIYQCFPGLTEMSSDLVIQEIKDRYRNYKFYEARPKYECNAFDYNRYCNESLTERDLDQLYCTSREKASPTPTPNFSDINLAIDDVYGLTCGVPGSSQKGHLFSKDHARCCSIPRGYNTQDEIKKASESLGCLIDTEILGKELRYLCFGGIVDSLLGMLRMDDLLFSIRQNPLLQAGEKTRACVEGVPLIPKAKQQAPNQAISSSSGSFITPRPTIMISHQSYVIATNEELGSEFNCQCYIVPNSLLDLCDYITGDSYNACLECVQNDKLYTALGCFPLKIRTFIQETMFPFLIGLAGMITLFCIIYSALQLQLSQGSPEKIKKSQEMLTSCITGLILIIFSVFILKLIGVNILRIPGFN